MSNAADNQFPYAGPAGVFWTVIEEPDGSVYVEPVQPTPPGGEPYLGQDTKSGEVYQDPPFNTELDQQAVESAIFDVKPEGFVWHWEGPWIPDVEDLGPPMATPLAGGHAANILFDPLSEFGVGEEPAFVYSPYEVYENPNIYYRDGWFDSRYGGKPLGGANVYAVLAEDVQDQAPTAYQLAWRGWKNRGGGRHAVVVPFPNLSSVTDNMAAVSHAAATSLDNLMPVTTDTY